MLTLNWRYTCIIQLANYYTDIIKTPKDIKFISKQLFIDLELAQTASRVFAQNNKLVFVDCIEKVPAIISVYKYNDQWMPVELKPDSIKLMDKTPSCNLCGTEVQVKTNAAFIARLSNVPFEPDLKFP